MKHFFSSPTLKKATKLLVQAFRLFQRKGANLSTEQRKLFEQELRSLQDAILKKDKATAKEKSKTIRDLSDHLFPKSSFEKLRNFVSALVIALLFALVIRQTLFELYEIPTGSMRPTLKEKDRLIVSKTTFGINTPLRLKQLYFDPTLVERNGIIVFSGEDMDIRDVDTRYFYLFPGKKQYVKRLIGKPEDTLYFYGGLIYGIDKEGNDISQQLQIKSLDKIEHIPFIHFEGKALTPSQPVNGVYTPTVIYQMNEPVAKLFVNESNQAVGEMLPIQINPGQISPAPSLFGDLWGIKNFGMGRLLTKQQVMQYTTDSLQGLSDGMLYLEIQHHPSLQNMKIKRDIRGRFRPMLSLSSSIIPLQEHHLKTLFSNLYTARFIVKNGLAYRYGLPETALQNPFLPKLDVPNGMYEFYHGKAYKISWQGIATELKKDHPLYQFDAKRIQLFYNLGIEFDTRVMPPNGYPTLFPSRYIYFRDGDLYAMGAPLLKASDPQLQAFHQAELMKENATYVPFIDHGAPILADGSLDKDLIKQFGLTIPQKSYLALGDNHAMSADSREFGFVPEVNLKGAPDFIFWPFGPRFGHPNQPAYPFMNLPRSIMWTVTALCIIGYSVYHKRRNKLPLL